MFLEFIIIHQLTLTHKYSLHKMTRCFYSAVCSAPRLAVDHVNQCPQGKPGGIQDRRRASPKTLVAIRSLISLEF